MTENKPKEKRIAEIIDAAVDEFVEKGFEKTTMESIAARANLTKGGVYHHFSGKDEILLAANMKFTEPVQALIEEISKIESPSRKLKTYIKRYLDYWAAHSRELIFTFLSITKSLSNPKFFKPFEDYASEMLAFFESIYIEGIEKGEFRNHDARGRALVLNSALDGVAMYLTKIRPLKLKDITGHFIRVFVEDLTVDRREERR